MMQKTQPRKICVIKTSDGFYKVIRFSPLLPIDNAFLRTRFTLGHVASDASEVNKDIDELRNKESVLWDVESSAIRVDYYPIPEKLCELCEIDGDGIITKFKTPMGDWEDAPAMKMKKARTIFYDINKIETMRQNALDAVHVNSALTIDYYALGKIYALNDTKTEARIVNDIIAAQSILADEIEMGDEELYCFDIKYQKGLIEGYSILLNILKIAPEFKDEIIIRYIILVDEDSTWDSTLTEKNEWISIRLPQAKNINAFVFITNNAEKVGEQIKLYGESSVTAVALYQKGEPIPQPLEQLEQLKHWKIGKISKEPLIEKHFWDYIKADIKNIFSINKYLHSKKELKTSNTQ